MVVYKPDGKKEEMVTRWANPCIFGHSSPSHTSLYRCTFGSEGGQELSILQQFVVIVADRPFDDVP